MLRTRYASWSTTARRSPRSTPTLVRTGRVGTVADPALFAAVAKAAEAR